MRAEVAAEVLVVGGALVEQGGMERSRRTPWHYQRLDRR